MKKKFLIMIAVITAVISCLWFFLKPAAKDPTLVTLYGNVDIRQFDIGFQVPGQITKMYFEEGDTIREGSLVAEIDAADYKLQEAKSESEVAKAYAAMVQAQSVYDKYTVLYGTGAISKLDFETVENTLKEARSAYNASVTAKDLLARQSDYSKLYALEEGIVTARLVEPGTIIQKGTAVYTLSKPRPIWVRAYINETDLGNIYDGMPAQIITDSTDPQTGARKTYKGHIGYISPVSEFTPKSVQTTDLRTDLVYMIRVYADNPDKFLRQGMPTTVLIDLKDTRVSKMDTVVINNITKKFEHTTAIDDLTLTIPTGQMTGIVGADAAGKTTLLRIIIGLLCADSGTVTTLGYDPARQKKELIAQIGYMPQKFGLYEDLSVRENLEFYADLKSVDKNFDELLDFTGLRPFQKRLAGNLSGGMKQKLGLACALLGDPKFLVLDEPSVGVDPISRRDLMRLVRATIKEDTTVIWSTAYLDEANSFDNTVVIDKGKVIFHGPPETLAATSADFEREVIRLMGGYEEKESQIAAHYIYRESTVEYPVEALNLLKMYGNFAAVKNNTFHIRKGEIFGLLGPNGAGKSTSFKMMCGLARPTDGTAKIMGVDIRKNPTLARSYLGYMAQKFSLYGNMSVRENLEFFAGIYGIPLAKIKERVGSIASYFGLTVYFDQLSEKLPLGIKQRLSLACALIHNPPILFLDEATSGVDVVTRKEFWCHLRALAKKGVTILITTHFMDEAEYCDNISLFYQGETIAVGTPAALKSQAAAATMEEAFITLINRKDAESGRL